MTCVLHTNHFSVSCNHCLRSFVFINCFLMYWMQFTCHDWVIYFVFMHKTHIDCLNVGYGHLLYWKLSLNAIINLKMLITTFCHWKLSLTFWLPNLCIDCIEIIDFKWWPTFTIPDFELSTQSMHLVGSHISKFY